MDKDLQRYLSPQTRMSPEERERLLRMARELPPRGLLFPDMPDMPEIPRPPSNVSPRTPQGPGFTGSPRSPQGPIGSGGPRDPWPSEQQWEQGTRSFIEALERFKRR